MRKRILVLWAALLLPLLGFSERLLIVADEAPIQVLQDYLSAEVGGEVERVDPSQVPPDLAPYDAVFQYIHGAMAPEVSSALIRYTQNGGRLVLLHHAIASARWKNPDFLEFVGIHLDPREHPETPWKVLANTTHILVNLNPRHYITSHDVTYDRTVSYRSSDRPSPEAERPALVFEKTEVFLNQQFTDGRDKTVLFGLQAADPQTGESYSQDRGGWLKPSGKGWIFYFQPGHAATDFQNRNYCQIIRNCLTWKP